ncbi:hypothetical protein GH714_010213 [Hevea brasiliensis]|uniref:Uncharacterized protein n=1 Tax=Hevea brasiliensis TaxID=3981 RepID=A0A6A6LFF7_HEVBR|nr:hypothetical protein GH714_010213 [Hevea brasiliensis]
MGVVLSKEKKFSNPIPIKEIFKKGIMAEQNAKMNMLINILDRQKWFMKKMAQMLFSESFGKFGDFGSYPQGTAGPSNAKAIGSSGVKILEGEEEEEEEEHVETIEKEKEESKLAEIEEVEKNDENYKTAEEKSEAEQEPDKEKLRESSSSHTKSNNNSENGKREGKNGSRQEEKKEGADNKKEGQSQYPSFDQPSPAPTTTQAVPESSISLPIQYGPRRTKAQARKSVLPIPPKIQVTIPEKDSPKKKNKPKLLILLTLGEVAGFLAAKINLEIF